MAAIKQLAAVTRSGTGKGAARSVRREGRVPAVIYGGGVRPEPISVDFKDVNKLIFAGHFLTTIFELEMDGRKERVLPRDYQLDVVTDWPVHVDFLRLTPGSRVRIGVPVHVENREASPGLKKGGTVNLVLHTVEVLAPADNIPESITIDLTGLDFAEFGACLGPQAAGRLQTGCRQDGPYGGDHRPADRHGGGACRRDGGSRRCGACRRRSAGQSRRQGCGRGPRQVRREEIRPKVPFRLAGRGFARATDRGAHARHSGNSAIRAPATRATATISVSWRSRRSLRRIVSGRFGGGFRGLRRTA